TCARVSPWWRVLCSRGLFSYAPSRPGLYALSLHDALPISLLLIANAAWSALALMMSLLVLTGVVELWHVFAFAGLLGVAQALETPVRQAFVAELVSTPLLPNALSLFAATF